MTKPLRIAVNAGANWIEVTALGNGTFAITASDLPSGDDWVVDPTRLGISPKTERAVSEDTESDLYSCFNGTERVRVGEVIYDMQAGEGLGLITADTPEDILSTKDDLEWYAWCGGDI